MRRTLFALVFLLILAAVVFYFGWVQLHVPAGMHAVFFSRTNGWEDRALTPGTFSWRWQRLIPTNATLYLFDTAPRTSTVSVEGTLPSSDVYEALLNIPSPFTYRVRLSVVLRVRPETLPALARDRDLRPEDLAAVYQAAESRIQQLGVASIARMIETPPQEFRLDEAHSAIAELVAGRLARELAEFEILAVVPQTVVLPDLELYRLARERTREVVDARARALQEAARAVAAEREASDRELVMLERYGQILERYPVLIEYFRVARDTGTDPLSLEALIPERGR